MRDLDDVLEDDREFLNRLFLRLGALRSEYGLFPLLALSGVLPMFPVTPLAGIVFGTFSLVAIQTGSAPVKGRTFALLGLVGGLLWVTVGVFLWHSLFEAI